MCPLIETETFSAMPHSYKMHTTWINNFFSNVWLFDFHLKLCHNVEIFLAFFFKSKQGQHLSTYLYDWTLLVHLLSGILSYSHSHFRLQWVLESSRESRLGNQLHQETLRCRKILASLPVFRQETATRWIPLVSLLVQVIHRLPPLKPRISEDPRCRR